jgi:hypothetical protein
MQNQWRAAKKFLKSKKKKKKKSRETCPVDRERKLWYLFYKQFPPLDVKLVHNAMESF